MIYLDTHVVVWLYVSAAEKLSPLAIQLIETNDVIISPMTQLELTYLNEAKRIHATADVIIHELQSKIGLLISDLSFEKISHKANKLSWTKDPFDRLIVANAICNSSKLLTKDRTIRKHYHLAVWD